MRPLPKFFLLMIWSALLCDSAWPQSAPQRVTLRVLVPDDDVVVFINGTRATQRGLERRFYSSPLRPGADGYYVVKAVWRLADVGKELSSEKTISVRSGETYLVDFRELALAERTARPKGARSLGAGGKAIALLAGVNRYDKRGFPDLEYAERDVEEFGVELRKLGFDIRLLTGRATGPNRATLANIQSAIESALTERTKTDLLLIAFAGHGIQSGVKGADGKLQAESFFCPRDADREKTETMLAMGWLFDALERRGGGHNLVLVDACRDDPSRSSGLDGSTVKALPEGVGVLFGCRAGQKSFESDKAGGGHGIFFHFVLEGLRGKARTSRRQVTWASLADYVSEQVTEKAAGLVGDNNIRQTPCLIANLPGRSPVLVSQTVLEEGDEAQATSTEEKVQVRFLGPPAVGASSMRIHWETSDGVFTPEPAVAPANFDFKSGSTVQLKLTHIPGVEDLTFYPTLELSRATERTKEIIHHQKIVVQITSADVAQVVSGQLIKKAYYLPSPEHAELAAAVIGDDPWPPCISTSNVDPGVDPVTEASRKGTVLAVFRFGNKDRREKDPPRIKGGDD